MPTIKTDVTNIGDPFVLLDNGVYYMYATSSGDGFKVYTSTDLANWQDKGLCYFAKDSFGYECFWAPEVVKRSDGVFVMHFTARQKGSCSLRIGVATSASPLGPFVDVVTGQPMFDFGYATIDAHCFCDNNGKNYLFYVRDVSENVCDDGVRRSQIYVGQIDDTLTKFVTDPICVLSPSGEQETTLGNGWCWNEGPFVLKYNGKYYLNYSYNCYDMKEYSVGVAVSDSIWGEYVKVDRNLLRFMEGDFSGPGHNAYFYDVDGNLVCTFHIHTHPEKPSGNRRACFAKAEFDKDGSLKVLYK